MGDSAVPLRSREPGAEGRFDLVRPSPEYLAGYVDALRQGWSPDNLRPATAAEQLARIAQDAGAFLAGLYDPDARGAAIALPDGSRVPRLPGYVLWMWDGAFCGSIGLRWQPGTEALPPYCLGHIGYAVVPWKQRRGYATRALAGMLPLARAEGLRYVDLHTVAENLASRRVIEANGGVLVGPYRKPDVHGGTEGLRYRIDLSRR